MFIHVPGEFRHRPYVKYASNGVDSIHMVYTEGHPRNYDNSLYHIFYRAGVLHDTRGVKIASLAKGMDRPQLGSRIFTGNPGNVAWPCDVHLDHEGRPTVVYSVQKDSRPLPPKHPESGADHRYRYAAWRGSHWNDFEIAYAGTRIYAGEDDYTGLACLDPDDTSRVFISTNADPVTGVPLLSDVDGQRHYEIFEGVTSDRGRTWRWTAVTRNSTADNLRPIVPKWNQQSTALLWLRGTMRTYTDFDLKPMAMIRKGKSPRIAPR